MRAFRGYRRAFQPRFHAFEPLARVNEPPAPPQLGDLASAAAPASAPTAPSSVDQMDPEVRRELAARVERLRQQNLVDAIRRRAQGPGERPRLPEGPSEAEQIIAQARQGVSLARQGASVLRTGRDIVRGMRQSPADTSPGDVSVAVEPGVGLADVGDDVTPTPEIRTAFQAQRAGERAPGLADLAATQAGAFAQPLSAPIRDILDIPAAAAAPEFVAPRGFAAPAPTGPIPTDFGATIGGAEVAGAGADAAGSSAAEAGGTAAAEGAASTGATLSGVASGALQALPWLAAALRAAQVLAGKGTAAQKAVGLGGTAVTLALPYLLNAAGAAAGVGAGAAAGGAAGGAAAGGAAGGAAAGGAAAGAAGTAGAAAAPAAVALTPALALAAPVAMGVAYAVDHILEMMSDVPHRLREALEYNQMTGQVNKMYEELLYRPNAVSFMESLEGWRQEPPGIRNRFLTEVGVPGGGAKVVGAGATLEDLFRNPHLINVKTQAGISQSMRDTLNEPLTNLVRQRMMLFALARAGVPDAVAALKRLHRDRKQYLTQRALAERKAREEQAALEAQAATQVG